MLLLHIRNDQSTDMETTPLVFVNNSAGIRVSVLYGGLPDKCNLTSDKYTSALQLFSMSIIQGSDVTGHALNFI